ncbi:hypothetical protein [Croceibacter atlanticus]|uniref:Uncharacterized protein n=1 Tax=Croceibacter atlanticus (strain ATCC BAA-628 / JCM 21780 / CIP 108009 / IAM 15332 / KCTC 12090 / HTCC2559) TaxID=216432 RepID=A3U8A0_CROAH|nr:hypothetical protein [Croceibacter atlanticus]EAP88467.1 hypothetical protein CA2559_06890 [Croceibacter atlanticus HTCC2559]MBW4969399.1 hypothetical protein [Croceibacter atlanticus]
MKLYLKHLMLFLSFLWITQGNSQNDSIPTNQIELLNSEYKDFVTVNNTIYAISQNSVLVAIDLKEDKHTIIKKDINAIAKKSNNDILFGSKEGEIFIINKKQKIKKIDEVDAEIFSILINPKDEYVIYSSKSIYYNGKDYIPKKETIFYGKLRVKYTGNQLIKPDYIYLDKMNFVWFAYNEGEWGGNVCFFDLNKKEFIYDKWLRLDDDVKYLDENDYFEKLNKKFPELIKVTEKDTVYKYPYNSSISSVTKGVAYNNTGDLFITSSGGGHTMLYATKNDFHYYVNGTIVKILKEEKDYYKSCFDQEILEDEKYKIAFERNFMGFKNKDRELRENILTENEINKLGPITFNQFDNKLYFFSTKGFYILDNLDCTFSKKLFFSPPLTCKSQYERDYCLHLNVVKFEFISEKEIIYLTKNNGIGYYNGERIKYFR